MCFVGYHTVSETNVICPAGSAIKCVTLVLLSKIVVIRAQAAGEV